MSYHEPDEPAGLLEPATVAAIVLDANAFGSGATPNVELIETWAQACREHEAELWIPRLVVLELAEHAMRADREQRAQMQAHSRQRLRWGLEPLTVPDEVTLADIEQAIEDAGANIVETDPQSAVAGLHDQVLGSGPASVKGKVKTGGSDSAWIRSVVAHRGGNGAGLVVVSADEGATKFARDLTREPLADSPIQFVANIGALAKLFNEDRPANDDERNEVLRTLRVLTTLSGTSPDLEQRSGLVWPTLWWDRPAEFSHAMYSMWDEPTFYLEPDPVEIVGDLMMDPWSGTVTGRVRFSGLVLEHFGIGDEEYPRESMRAGYVEGTATVAISRAGVGTWIAMDNVRLGLTP
jgi:hypothetical protein